MSLPLSLSMQVGLRLSAPILCLDMTDLALDYLVPFIKRCLQRRAFITCLLYLCTSHYAQLCETDGVVTITKETRKHELHLFICALTIATY